MASEDFLQTAIVVPSPAPFDKTLIRDRVRGERRDFARSLTPEVRGALEAGLADALSPLWLGARIVAGYFPMKDEIDPAEALAAARSAGCDTALPAFVERDSRMSFHGGEADEIGPWGVRQPSPGSPPLHPDLVLVPCVAVDGRGNRIGQGKGHYDRALAALRAGGAVRVIGIGWGLQLIDDILVPDAWDIPLDGFASPDGLVLFR